MPGKNLLMMTDREVQGLQHMVLCKLVSSNSGDLARLLAMDSRSGGRCGPQPTPAILQLRKHQVVFVRSVLVVFCAKGPCKLLVASFFPFRKSMAEGRTMILVGFPCPRPMQIVRSKVSHLSKTIKEIGF